MIITKVGYCNVCKGLVFQFLIHADKKYCVHCNNLIKEYLTVPLHYYSQLLSIVTNSGKDSHRLVSTVKGREIYEEINSFIPPILKIELEDVNNIPIEALKEIFLEMFI